MPTKKPKVFVVHLGCAKNQVDAENLVGEMLHAGFATCDSAAKADYILVNTCGFIEAAKEESINAILAQVKGKKAKQKLIVSGCLSGRYGKELEKELPEVDYWVGTYKPGELLKKMGIVAPKGCDAENLARMNLGGFKHHAYLKIAEGCNRRCAYCAIPLIRGKQVSRSIEDIVAEAKELEAQGVQEITLIAQDTTYFGREKGKKGGTLAQLLKAILDNTNIPWIRTLYWYPMFVDDELLDLMANEPRLVKYVDMPIPLHGIAVEKIHERNAADHEEQRHCEIENTLDNIGREPEILGSCIEPEAVVRMQGQYRKRGDHDDERDIICRLFSLHESYFRASCTKAEARLASKRPLTFGESSFMILPMSFGLAAPVAALISAMRALTSSSVISAGMY